MRVNLNLELEMCMCLIWFGGKCWIYSLVLKSRRIITSRNVVFDESSVIILDKDLFICNHVASSHETKEKVELENASNDDVMI